MSGKKSTALSVKSISLDNIKVRCDKKREEKVNIAGMHLLLSIEEELGIFLMPLNKITEIFGFIWYILLLFELPNRCSIYIFLLKTLACDCSLLQAAALQPKHVYTVNFQSVLAHFPVIEKQCTGYFLQMLKLI